MSRLTKSEKADRDFVERLKKLADDETLIEDERRILLKERGWEHSCDYPDCCWRWSKQFDEDGEVITQGSVEHALDVERDVLAIRNPEAWPPEEAY